MQQRTDHPAHGHFDLLLGAGAAVVGADLVQLGVQHRHGVLAQGHDRLVHAARVLGRLEPAGGALHDLVCGAHGLTGFLGRGHAHGLEGDQLHARQIGHGGVEVSGQREVHHGARPVREGGRGHGSGAAGAPDDHVRPAQGRRKARVRHGGASALVRELLGTSGAGVDLDVRAPAVPQGGHGGTRVRPGAEHEGVASGPVARGDVVGEVQRHRHDGASAFAEPRAGAHLAGGAGRGLEQLHEVTRGGARLAGLGEGPADLARDLALAHHGGLQPGDHGEQVTGDLGPLVRVHGLEHEPLVQAGTFRDPLRKLLLGAGHVARVVLGQLTVELEPVARGEGDGSRQRTAGHGVLGHAEGPGAQPGHSVEVNGAVRCDKTEKNHNPAILDEVVLLRPA